MLSPGHRTRSVGKTWMFGVYGVGGEGGGFAADSGQETGHSLAVRIVFRKFASQPTFLQSCFRTQQSCKPKGRDQSDTTGPCERPSQCQCDQTGVERVPHDAVDAGLNQLGGVERFWVWSPVRAQGMDAGDAKDGTDDEQGYAKRLKTPVPRSGSEGRCRD
jgi:hypothetical protein